MKNSKIEVNKVYEITIGKNTTTVQILSVERRVNGQLAYHCENTKSNKPLVIADTKRFLREIKSEKPAKTVSAEKTKTERPDGKVSGLMAAYIVLAEAAESLNIRQIMDLGSTSAGLVNWGARPLGLQWLPPYFVRSKTSTRIHVSSNPAKDFLPPNKTFITTSKSRSSNNENRMALLQSRKTALVFAGHGGRTTGVNLFRFAGRHQF